MLSLFNLSLMSRRTFSGVGPVRQSVVARWLLAGTLVWVALMLGSLRTGLLHPFFFYEGQEGFDYYCIPRGFLNVLQGKSLYATFDGVPFGPRATWYLAHPLYEFVVAPWFSFFEPSTSLTLFRLATLALLLAAGVLFAKRARSAELRALCVFTSVFGWPTYWLLYVGNMHAWLTFGLALTLLGLFDLANANEGSEGQSRGGRTLLAGTLICLFTKPLALTWLPMLLLLRETRRGTVRALGAYVALSLPFLPRSPLNPEGVGLARVLELVLQPEWVRAHMNVYTRRFVLSPEMKDNSIHWLNLVAQSDFSWDHVQIFSLSAFANHALGAELPPLLYKLPLLAAVGLSCFLWRLQPRAVRLRGAALMVAAQAMAFFLSYNTVWEYQYTSVMPVLGLGLLLWESEPRLRRGLRVVFALGLLVALPTPYFWLRPEVPETAFTLLRATRVLPALGLFLVLLGLVAKVGSASRAAS